VISLMWKVQKLTAEHIGCGDCTMLEDWCTTTVQKPSKCPLNDCYIYCPVTGKMPGDYEKAAREMRYLYVDEDGVK